MSTRSSPRTAGAAADPALVLARQSLYRFASLALSDPRAGSWSRLADEGTRAVVERAAALVREEPGARAEKLAPGERPLERLDPVAVFRHLPDSQEGLNELYERTFGLLASGGACPPHETDYLDSKWTFRRSQELADVSGYYLAFGLRPSARHPERHDHIALELEFQASLLGLERSADTPEKAEICRDAQRGFLESHLAWWAPAFARLLEAESGGGYYAAVAEFLAALIPAERALLGVEAANPRRPVTPSPVEPPEECEGCPLEP